MAVHTEDGAMEYLEDKVLIDEEFQGKFSLKFSKRITLINPWVTGDYFLFDSHNAKVIGGDYFGEETFSGAHNILAFIDSNLPHLSMPHSGIVVARSIGEFEYLPSLCDNPKVYTCEKSWRCRLREKMMRLYGYAEPPIKLISPVFFDEFKRSIDKDTIQKILPIVDQYLIK